MKRAKLSELFDSILMQHRLIRNFFYLEDAGAVLVRGAREKGAVGTGLLIYSMFEPIKLWIPLLVINAGAWMGIIRLFLKNRRESEK